jgi:hypothetical protein
LQKNTSIILIIIAKYHGENEFLRGSSRVPGYYYAFSKATHSVVAVI